MSRKNHNEARPMTLGALLLALGTAMVTLIAPASPQNVAKTAVFIEPASTTGAPPGYNDLLATAIADEIARWGLRPSDRSNFDKSKYTHVFQVEITTTSETTRININLLAAEDGHMIFPYAFWIDAGDLASAAKRIKIELHTLEREFRGRIYTLYKIHSAAKSGPNILAGCIFPAPSSNADWMAASYITSKYVEDLRTKPIARSFNVVGVPSSVFPEWCKPENPALPISAWNFDANIYGQTFMFPGGDKILVWYQPKNEEPIPRSISVEATPDQTAASVSSAIDQIAGGH